MKPLPILKLTLVVAGCTLFACQKETSSTFPNDVQSSITQRAKPKDYTIKGDFAAFYHFVPDVGWTYPNPGPGWYPGGATGNLNHLGKCEALFNQYATLGPDGLHSVAAPLSMFFSAKLNELGINIPVEAGTVGMVFFDKQGNSILSRVVGAGIYVPVSPTRVEGKGSYFEIIGGTGKFANATGHYSFDAYLNPTDTSDAGFKVYDGVINY